MEEYLLYLFYLVVILILGILITAITNRFRISNILFLILAGYTLKIFKFNFFNEEILLVLSSLALIMIILESTMDMNLAEIIKDFFPVFKYSIVYFFFSTYILTLLIFQIFDFPVKDFNVFVLCLLLSIIIYGVDPSIATEFSRIKNTSKKSKIKEKIIDMLEIEGMITGPIVVIFSFFLISYVLSSDISFTAGLMSQSIELIKQILISVTIGLFIGFLFFKLTQHFKIAKELSALLCITTGISVFVLSEALKTNGTTALAVYGLILRGLFKENMPKKYTSIFAHTLYLIVFILLGIEFFFPGLVLWPRIIVIFVAYLILRFFFIYLMIKDINIKQKIFMAFNSAKGIEVAIVLVIMKLNFSHIEGFKMILSIGFSFFILSYLLSTAVNHYSNYFLNEIQKNSKRFTKKKR